MIMFNHIESLTRQCSPVTHRVTSHVTRDIPLTHGATPTIFRLWPVWCTIKIKQGYQTVTSVIQNITQNRPSVCKNSGVYM